MFVCGHVDVAALAVLIFMASKGIPPPLGRHSSGIVLANDLRVPVGVKGGLVFEKKFLRPWCAWAIVPERPSCQESTKVRLRSNLACLKVATAMEERASGDSPFPESVAVLARFGNSCQCWLS